MKIFISQEYILMICLTMQVRSLFGSRNNSLYSLPTWLSWSPLQKGNTYYLIYLPIHDRNLLNYVINNKCIFILNRNCEIGLLLKPSGNKCFKVSHLSSSINLTLFFKLVKELNDFQIFSKTFDLHTQLFENASSALGT